MRRNSLFFLAFLLIGSATAAPSEPVVVYSARNEQLIKPLFDAYTAATGQPVRWVTDKEGPLLARLNAEGADTPADLLLTVDAGNLWFAAEQGLLRATRSAALEAAIPAHLRDPDGRWFGLSVRARTMVYAPARVQAGELVGYADLALPKWRGRLCLRTSQKVYNQSLVAMLIGELGAARAREVVSGWVANLATAPFASDNQVIEAIAAGQCDVGLVNTYYYARLRAARPDLPVALAWADQAGSGVHVNISGAGVTRHAKQPQAAQRLLEWLASPVAQQMFAAQNLEFPADPRVAADPQVAAWGTFKPSTRNLREAGARQAEAVMLMDAVGYR